MGRAPCCEKVGLKRGRWTAEEDQLLTKYIQANGEGSWRSLPKNAGLLRCGKSCRLRWINYLRADLKRGNITTEEEETIVNLHSALGNRWSLIAAHLPGRTDNEIKNYWNSYLRKIYSLTEPSKNDSTSTCTSTSITPCSNNIMNTTIKLAGTSLRKRKGPRTRTQTGRSSSITIKKSIGLPKSDTTNQLLDDHQPTAKEKATPVINNINASTSVVGQTTEIGDPKKSVELGLHGSCMESGGGSEASSSSSSREETKNEVLGPNEWLDSEIKRLHNTLIQRDQGEEEVGTHDHTSGNDIEALVDHHKQEKKETASGVLSVDGDQERQDMSDKMMVIKGGDLAKSSGLDDEEYWVDWDQYWVDGGVEKCFNTSSNNNISEWELWDDQEGDKLLCWLWEGGVENN